MILVDTSVWIQHFRHTETRLAAALNREEVLTHPFVVGELACGNLRNRGEILELLQHLPSAPVATDEEVLEFIETRKLMGRGIGYIDVHLLASTALSGPACLWTRDKRLDEVAAMLGLATDPAPSHPVPA